MNGRHIFALRMTKVKVDVVFTGRRGRKRCFGVVVNLSDYFSKFSTYDRSTVILKLQASTGVYSNYANFRVSGFLYAENTFYAEYRHGNRGAKVYNLK